jgi:OOP family OmpA-OmpF porin
MMSKKSLGIAVTAMVGLGIALPSPAQQQQRAMRTAPAWYFGVGGGVGWADFNNNDFNNVASGFNGVGIGGGGLSQSTSRETTDFGWKVFGGYRFNQYFAIEGGYTDLGKFDYQYQFNQGGTQVGTGNMSYEVGSWNIALVPRFPLENGLFVQGKIGAAFTRAENSFNLTLPGFSQSGSDSKSETKPLLGVGLGYDFANGLSVVGEYEYYGEAGSPFSYGSNGILGTGRADTSLFSVSGMIRF